MVKNKTKLSLILIGIALLIGYYGYSTYAKSKDLSYNELTNSIEQHWFEGKPMNFTIELEKDVEDLHLLLLSYQPAPNFPQVTGLATFKRLQNGKYKYFGFMQSSSGILPKELTGFERNYGVFCGIITDNQPTKYLIDGELTDTFEKNKYFIRVYDLNSKSGFSMQAIYN
ncbi:hypothetical protein E4K67_01830 [Desulfosporosinus fructosivorans]|uniref:Uncharacterized protein n=1 Tax=Desulfosporosinus fructosivorans TaxID=2018669 RepID=A0A4Z0RBZ5_9FIRM|nr:hypothetical protein [Desulfosporosinus fructosivorans]TGE39759.1 hypothetical protein E4K67_01830 [Desulfosporosinus fructosivorans]